MLSQKTNWNLTFKDWFQKVYLEIEEIKKRLDKIEEKMK